MASGELEASLSAALSLQMVPSLSVVSSLLMVSSLKIDRQGSLHRKLMPQRIVRPLRQESNPKASPFCWRSELLDVQAVVEAVVHSLCNPRPRVRYPIGGLHRGVMAGGRHSQGISSPFQESRREFPMMTEESLGRVQFGCCAARSIGLGLQRTQRQGS